MSLDERNALLNKKISESDLPDAVESLVNAAKRQHRLTNFIIFVLAIDMLLTVAVGFILESQHRQDVAIFKNNNSITVGCETNNTFRKGDHALWTYILAIPPQTPFTAQQQAVRANFEKVVTKTFALRDCNKV